MKKIVSFLVTIMLLATPLIAYADMGVPLVVVYDYDVYVDVGGMSFEYQAGNPDHTVTETTANLEPGQKLHLLGKISDDAVRVEFSVDSKDGFVTLSESFINEHTIKYNEVVDPKKTTQTFCTRKARIVETVGVDLRIGPNENYPSKSIIPNGSELIYDHIWEHQGIQWAYVTYYGENGWISLKNTQQAEISVSSQAPASTVSPQDGEISESVSKQPLEKSSTEKIYREENGNTEDKTQIIVLVILVIAALISVGAMVVILVLNNQKKKNKNDNETNNNIPGSGIR